MNSSCFATLADSGERLGRASHVLLCLDIERSLFPAEDKLTRLPELRLGQLRRLASKPRLTLAIFSSRSRAELQAQVGLPGVVYVGNLGLEISGDGFLMVEPSAAGYSEELARTAARLAARLANVPGARVEDKGLTIRITGPHDEGAESEELRHGIHETLAGANHPFHLTTYDHTYEIRPRVPWTKANAINWIKERLGQLESLVLYVSDDENETDTPAALSGSGNAMVVQVPPAKETTTAHCRLDGSADIWPFLSWLERVVSGEK